MNKMCNCNMPVCHCLGIDKTFYISEKNDISGPGIFGTRLAKSLIDLGYIEKNSGYNRIIFGNQAQISGMNCYDKRKNNILRLDGLFLDSENTIGNSIEMNKNLFECYKNFDAVVFQSEFAKKCYEAHTNYIHSNSTIIYNGVGKEFYEFKINRTPFPDYWKFTIICSASWRRHKRLEEILAAFSLLPNNGEIGLAVLGKLPKEEKYYEDWLLKETGISITHLVKQGKIKFFGNVHPDALPYFYYNADLGIHISYLDWCPNSVVEMLSCRLPVLCNHNGGTQELIQQCCNGVIIRLENDYQFGTDVALYNPPEINIKYFSDRINELINILIDGYNKNLEFPLTIENSARRYVEMFR